MSFVLVCTRIRVDMEHDVVAIVIKGVMPTAAGCAVFLGNEEKNFVIHLDPNMGLALTMHLQHIQKERPLTHDLIGIIFKGLGIHIEHVVINAIEGEVFFSRIILTMKNELGSKIVEIDSRPSDALVLALQAERPILISRQVLDEVEDISNMLDKILSQEEGSEGESSGPEPAQDE